MSWKLVTSIGTLIYPTKAEALAAKERLGEGGTVHEEPEPAKDTRPTIRTTEGDVPLINRSQTSCQHESCDRRETFNQKEGRTVYWCAGCGGSIEYRRHPESGVLIEIVVG